jgi:hypothetical protein
MRLEILKVQDVDAGLQGCDRGVKIGSADLMVTILDSSRVERQSSSLSIVIS